MHSRFACSAVHVGGRTLSPWRLCAQAGVCAGVGALLAVSALTGASLLTALCLVPPALGGFAAFGLLRRAATGRETTVLLEHVAVAELIWSLTLAACDLPLLPWLDRLNVGLCVTLAFGRIGCLCVGCCYGVPASFGVRYPPECHPDTPGTPRLPVQAVESAAWLALAMLAATLAVRRAPGVATSTVAVSYALLRVGLERLRGDPRPHWRGVSASTAWSIALLFVGLWLDARGGVSRRALGPLVAGGAVGLMLLLFRRRWLAHDEAVVLDGVALRVHARSLASSPPGAEVEVTTVSGVRVGASTAGDVLLVTFSAERGSRDMLRLAAKEWSDGYGRAPLAQGPHGALWVLEVPVRSLAATPEPPAAVPEARAEPTEPERLPESYFTPAREARAPEDAS